MSDVDASIKTIYVENRKEAIAQKQHAHEHERSLFRFRLVARLYLELQLRLHRIIEKTLQCDVTALCVDEEELASSVAVYDRVANDVTIGIGCAHLHDKLAQGQVLSDVCAVRVFFEDRCVFVASDVNPYDGFRSVERVGAVERRKTQL